MTDIDDSAFGDSVYQANDDDAEYLDPAETLRDEDLDEPLDTSYSPPDFEPSATRYGTTDFEQAQGESLDQRLAQEVPDLDLNPIADFGGAEDAVDLRAGRLVQPDEGAHADLEKAPIAYDVGKAGSAASAEEAAVHIVNEDELDRDFIVEEPLTEDH